MRLFWEEVKKIWRPGILVVLAVLGVLYYATLLAFLVPEESTIRVRLELLERFGPTLEADELDDLETLYQTSRAELDAFIAGLPEAGAYGITDYDSFESAAYKNEEYEAFNAVLPAVYSSDAYFWMQTLNYYLNIYEDADNSDRWLDMYGEREQGRILELRNAPWGWLLSSADTLTNNLDRYSQRMTVCAVLSVILLLSPTFVRDRLRRTRAMQWASRRGRRVLHTQMGAALTSALVLTVGNIGVFSLPLLKTGLWELRSVPLTTGLCGLLPWFNWNLGQYLLALAAMVLVFGTAAGLLAVFLSQYSGGYVVMLLKAVPLFLVVGEVIANWAMDGVFVLHPDRSRPAGIEVACALVLLVTGLGLCAWTCLRQRKRELAE